MLGKNTTNFFFRNIDAPNEQQLMEDLVVESISIHGIDVYFIPRTLNNFDSITASDDSSSYNKAYMIAMYIESYQAFAGDGSFMSKFGLEIRDQIILTVSQRVFSEEITIDNSQIRPNEGDLIYFPLNKKCFQIKFVDPFEMYYDLGKLYTFRLTCEVFNYSGENMNTGIPEIDILQSKFGTNILGSTLLNEDGLALTDESGEYLVIENYNDTLPGDDTNAIEKESLTFIDWSEENPFAEDI